MIIFKNKFLFFYFFTAILFCIDIQILSILYILFFTLIVYFHIRLVKEEIKEKKLIRDYELERAREMLDKSKKNKKKK